MADETRSDIDAALDRALERLPARAAPPALRRRLAALVNAGAASGSSAVPPTTAPTTEGRRASRWAAPFVSACAAAALVLIVVRVSAPRPAPGGAADLVAEAVNDHIRVISSTHPVDIESGGIHQVKPWFAGRVDFSPDVRDFKSQGYELIGGRMDYLAHATVAALVYTHRAHKINAFTWPASEHDPVEPASEQRRGYHVLRWREGGMMWCVVSDASEATLVELRRLIESGDGASTQLMH